MCSLSSRAAAPACMVCLLLFVAIILIIMSVSGKPPRCSSEIRCLEIHSVQFSSCPLHSRFFLENPSQPSKMLCLLLVCVYFPPYVLMLVFLWVFFAFLVFSYLLNFYFLFFPKSYLWSKHANKMLQSSCAFDYLSLVMLANLHFIYLQDRVNGLKLQINTWLPSLAVYIPDSLLLLTVSFCIFPGKEGEAVQIWVYSSLNCWNH